MRKNFFFFFFLSSDLVPDIQTCLLSMFNKQVVYTIMFFVRVGVFVVFFSL